MIRRYAIVCQLWREGDQDFLGLEYDMAAGCSILAGRIAIDTRSRHIIGSDAGDRAFHAAIFYNDRGAVPEIAAKDLRRLRRYIIQRKGVLPVRNPVRVRGERRRQRTPVSVRSCLSNSAYAAAPGGICVGCNDRTSRPTLSTSRSTPPVVTEQRR